MVASRSHLGWIAGVLLGQQLGRASGASSCTTITVSGADYLDGTYTKGITTGDPFYRAGGTTFYEIYQFTGTDIAGWYISVGNAVLYRVYDPALHPADITLDWVECDGVYDCNLGPAVLQPVITCEGDTVPPTPSSAIETPNPSPSPSPPPTAAETEPDVQVLCGSGYSCATATDRVTADVVCSTDPCNDDDCCEPGDTIAPTPSPTPDGSDDNDNDNSESPSPVPSPTTAEEDTDVTPVPVGSPAESGQISAPEDDDAGNSGDGDSVITTELMVGVLSTLISAGILSAIGYVFRRNRSTAAPSS